MAHVANTAFGMASIQSRGLGTAVIEQRSRQSGLGVVAFEQRSRGLGAVVAQKRPSGFGAAMLEERAGLGCGKPSDGSMGAWWEYLLDLTKLTQAIGINKCAASDELFRDDTRFREASIMFGGPIPVQLQAIISSESPCTKADLRKIVETFKATSGAFSTNDPGVQMTGYTANPDTNALPSWVLPVGIGAGVLAVGGIAYLALRKKKRK